MEDFTSPDRFFQNGSLNVPWHDDLIVQLIAIDDIGAFAALAFADPGHYLGQAVEITGDRLTAPQIADALSAAAGRPIPHTQIPLETLREHAPEAAKPGSWPSWSPRRPDRPPPATTSLGARSGMTRRGKRRAFLPGTRTRARHRGRTPVVPPG